MRVPASTLTAPAVSKVVRQPPVPAPLEARPEAATEAFRPDWFPRLLWAGAIPLGALASLAIFIFIGWLQPAVGGSERITLPALIHFKVAKSEPPPPPPPEERPQEEPPRKQARARPERPRSTRTPVSRPPKFASVLGAIQTLLPGGVGIGASLNLEAAEVAIDSTNLRTKDVVERARRQRKRLEAREMSYLGGRSGGSLSQFTKPRLINDVKPEYPPEARSREIEGYVVAKVLISMVGDVSEIEIVTAYPPGYFEGCVEEALRRWTFSPARDDAGNPVDFWKTVKLKFELESSR